MIRRKMKQILAIAGIAALLVAALPVMADSEYGTVARTGDTYEARISHSSLANKEVAFLVYDLKGDLDQIDSQYIGYIDQATADESGTLTFSNISLPTPESGSVTYGVYIGAEGLDREKIGEIPLSASEEEVQLGDMNKDGSITAVDALLALRAWSEGATDAQIKIGDVNKDSELDVDDVLLILQASAGAIEGFGN